MSYQLSVVVAMVSFTGQYGHFWLCEFGEIYIYMNIFILDEKNI